MVAGPPKTTVIAHEHRKTLRNQGGMAMADLLPRISTHLGYFGTGADRYNPAGYQAAVPGRERVLLAGKVVGLGGVELNYPSLVTEETVESCKTALSEAHLAVSNVSLNVWGAGKWGLGSLSHPDEKVRAEAIAVCKRGLVVARAVGSPLVSLWPGQDGFDYPFQVDYRSQVDWFVAGLREIAASAPDMRICLEYKPKEPRTHSLLDTAARTMWLISKVGAGNVGVLLDVGHAFCAYENAAQSAALLQREGLLYLLHFNDNYGEWDWDMIPGSLRFWELLELIFWLRETGYDGWYSIDITMPRGDPLGAAQLSVSNIERLCRLTSKLDRATILANLQLTDQYRNLHLLSDTVFRALES
jgi:xylose isomerase